MFKILFFLLCPIFYVLETINNQSCYNIYPPPPQPLLKKEEISKYERQSKNFSLFCSLAICTHFQICILKTLPFSISQSHSNCCVGSVPGPGIKTNQKPKLKNWRLKNDFRMNVSMKIFCKLFFFHLATVLFADQTDCSGWSKVARIQCKHHLEHLGLLFT